MKHQLPNTQTHKNYAAHWDGRDVLARLQLVMENAELFWAMRLITRSEIALVRAMRDSDTDYVLMREDQPLFTSINLKKEIAAQQHREQLEAALKAVFK